MACNIRVACIGNRESHGATKRRWCLRAELGSRFSATRAATSLIVGWCRVFRPLETSRVFCPSRKHKGLTAQLIDRGSQPCSL